MAKEWVATCKDCGKEFRYSDNSYTRDEERGFSRPERCPACRLLRKREIDASGAGYYQIRIVGDEPLSPGILGHVYHGERPHIAEEKPSDVSKFKFGIKEHNIKDVYRAFDEEGYRIAVIEGPTGSGKSTYLPYRLIEAPEGVRTPDIFTRDGQVVVTQPRILPTSGISKFISESLNGSSMGQGVDIGYRYSGNTQTDRRNRLVFVTDGTLINWIKNDQLSHISVIMIDEAHERSKNIDLILMLLRNNLPRYPKLKVIIASATINAQDFINYYGGSSKVRHLKFEGMIFDVVENSPPKPLVDYENLLKKPSKQIDEEISDVITAKVLEVVEIIRYGNHTLKGDVLAFLHSENSVDLAVSKIQKKLSEIGLQRIVVLPLYRNLSSTRQNKVLEKKAQIITNKIINHWINNGTKTTKDVIGVLLDDKSVSQTMDNLSEALKKNESLRNAIAIPFLSLDAFNQLEEKGDHAEKRAIITNYQNLTDAKNLFPSARIIDDWRVVIATNVAETSLTVDGTVHVIDSGLIKQNEFDPDTRTQRLKSKTHSQAGCKQRKGRAGRIRPGFAHYLYTKEQFESFLEYTPPEVERSPLDDLVLQAKAAGIGNLETFAWFNPTENMLREVAQAQESLKVRGAIDSDGEITEVGLTMLNMTIDPLVASFLMKADQLCCALEAANLLTFVTLNTPIKESLFVWNRDWDSQTRWEIKQRQKAFYLDCQDDFELILRTLAAWENVSSSQSQRASWAKQMYVNHNFIQNRLLPARDEILELLSAGLRGKAERPVDLALLDRVRFAAMLAVKDQIASEGDELVARDSLCWLNTPHKFVYLKKTPYKITNSESRYYQVSLIGLIKENWLERDYEKELFTGYLPLVKELSSRQPDGQILQNKAVHWPLAALFPPGTEIAGRISSENSMIGAARILASAAPIKEVGGWGRAQELITEYQVEEEIGKDETVDFVEKIKAADLETLKEYEDEEEEVFQVPSSESRAIFFFSELPGKIHSFNVNSKEGWVFEGVPPLNESSFQIMLPPGDHQLYIKPAFEETIKTDYQASLWMRVEEGKDYVVILGKWRGKHPAGNFVLEDVPCQNKHNQASLRWIPLGWKDRPIQVVISKQPKPMKGYYFFKAGKEIPVEVYPKDAPFEEKNLLGTLKLTLSEKHGYTLLIHNQFEKSTEPEFELLEDDFSKKDDVINKLPIPIQYSLIENRQDNASTNINEVFIMEEAWAHEDHVEVCLSVKDEVNSFEEFSRLFNPGDVIKVEPIDVDLYPNGNENALIVREPQSGHIIAVRAIDLFFNSMHSGLLLAEFLKFDVIELEVEWIDKHQERVGLTRLDLLSNTISEHLDKNGSIQMQTEVLKIESLYYPKGLVVRIDINEAYFLPGLIWEQVLLRNSPKPLFDFLAGDRLDVILKFTGGDVKSAKITDEQITALQSKLGHLKIKPLGTTTQYQVYRPIKPEEYTDLFAIDDGNDFQWMIRELYRRSNQPRIEFYDRENLQSIEKEYPIGSIITAKVSTVYDKKVEAEVRPGVFGLIPISEWLNQYVESLKDETTIGEIVSAKVLAIKEDGQLLLSRAKAALDQFKIGMICKGKIVEVQDDFLNVSIEYDAKSGAKLQTLNARVYKSQAIYPFLPDHREARTGQYFSIGDDRAVRITNIRVDDKHIYIDGTINKAYQGLMKVTASSSRLIGILIGKSGDNIRTIQKNCQCSISNKALTDGTTLLTLASESENNIVKGRQEIQKIISDAEWIGYQ